MVIVIVIVFVIAIDIDIDIVIVIVVVMMIGIGITFFMLPKRLLKDLCLRPPLSLHPTPRVHTIWHVSRCPNPSSHMPTSPFPLHTLATSD
jgi:hypothetical protein